MVCAWGYKYSERTAKRGRLIRGDKRLVPCVRGTEGEDQCFAYHRALLESVVGKVHISSNVSSIEKQMIGQRASIMAAYTWLQTLSRVLPLILINVYLGYIRLCAYYSAVHTRAELTHSAR